MNNRRALPILLLVALGLWLGCNKTANSFRAGDIVFQDLDSPQSQAIKVATGSEWTHCGLVMEQDGRFVVYEAVQPVQAVPLDEWVARGVNQRVVVKRLINGELILSPEITDRMRDAAHQQLGKSYDIYFNWSDDQWYCSELVWKVFDRAVGVQLATLRPLRDYDLDHPAVHAMMTERYGDSIPYDELMVSPQDLFTSSLLETIYDSHVK